MLQRVVERWQFVFDFWIKALPNTQLKLFFIRFQNKNIRIQSYASNLFLKAIFYVSFDIFISTSRTTLIFSPKHFLMFGKCFQYLQHVFKMIFHDSTAVWSENLLKKWKDPSFSGSPIIRFSLFWGDFHFKPL